MPSIVVDRIGPSGTYSTLAEWAADLPADLTAVDEIRVAELGLLDEDPGGAVIETVCDATRYVAIRAEAGGSVADRSDPDSDPLRIEPGQGPLIRAVSGSAVALAGASTSAEVHGVQILTLDGPALSVDQSGAAFARVSQCILDCNSTTAGAVVRGVDAAICSTVVVQRGSGDGIELADGASAEGCTVFKPEQPVATGIGVLTSGTPSSGVHSVAVSGFSQSFSTGIANATNCGSDQINLLSAPDDLSDPYWTRVSASIDPADTIVGPTGIALQRVGNNLNGFSFFSAPVVQTLAPGESFAFSMIASDVTAVISALLIDSSVGKPEMRVNWQASPPSVGILGATAHLQAKVGTLTDLGGGAYRLYLEAENTTSGPVDVTPIFYVTRGVENVGLDVGMYAGAAMAGNGHLGNGFAYPNAVPGLNPVEGFDPDRVYVEDQPALLDLRPVPGAALDTPGGTPTDDAVDLYRRFRSFPETIGAVALSTEAVASPTDIQITASIDSVHAFDEAEIIAAYVSRKVLPASPVRVLTG